jgi:hypothetical protein
MGKRSMRRDRENQLKRPAPRARVSELDLVRASPYGPAAGVTPHQEAEHTAAPDHMPPEAKISLASTGASTHGRLRPVTGAKSRAAGRMRRSSIDRVESEDQQERAEWQANGPATTQKEARGYPVPFLTDNGTVCQYGYRTPAQVRAEHATMAMAA